MSERSEIQGIIIHSMLTGLRQHVSPAQALSVKDHLNAARGPGTFERLEVMRRLAWVSADDCLALVQATWDVLGADGYPVFWEKMGAVFLDSAFAAVLKGFQTAFGIGPTNMLRAMTVIWGMISRHCGKFVFRDGSTKTTAVLVFDGAPGGFFEGHFVEGLAQGLKVSFALAGMKGTLTPVRTGPNQVELQASWG